MDRLKVGLLGATGLVGQVFVSLLSRHPWFDLVALSASHQKSGRSYGEVVSWIVERCLPEDVAELRLLNLDPNEFSGVDIIFSALPSDIASHIEPKFAEEGFTVISNSSNLRLDPDIPLIVPEVNPEHLALIKIQRRWRGRIVKNPNCSTAILTMTLKPLMEHGLRRAFVTTLQAVSGAGFAGVPSLAITDNVIPHIPREEDKLSKEPRKILGTLTNSGVREADISIAATTTRVPTRHGHLESVLVELSEELSEEELAECFSRFKGPPQDLSLPTAPANPIVVRRKVDRPQPLLDRTEGGGMSVSVGRISRLGWHGRWYRYVALGHNLVRGAAGNAVLIAELLSYIGNSDSRPF